MNKPYDLPPGDPIPEEEDKCPECGSSLAYFKQLDWGYIICTYCPSYGRARCSSGYGRAAAYLFKKGDRRKFSKMFKIYIPFLSIIWFLPLISSLFLLINEFSWALVVIVILFIIISFIVLPYYSRVHSCKKCPNKKECPWRRQ